MMSATPSGSGRRRRRGTDHRNVDRHVVRRGRNRSFVEKLRAAGVEFGKAPEPSEELPQVLAGKAVVVTGTLDGLVAGGGEAAIIGPRRQEPGSVSARRSRSSWADTGRQQGQQG